MLSIVTCPKCGYRWVYSGSSRRARCPRCGAVLSVRKHGIAVPHSVLRQLMAGERAPQLEDDVRMYRNALTAVMRAVGFVRVSEVAKVVSRDAVEDLLQTARNSPELVVIHADEDAAIVHRDVLCGGST